MNPRSEWFVLILINLINLIRLIQGNYSNESEPIRNQVFNSNQSELILIQTEFSIRIDPNHSEVEMTRINSNSSNSI